MSGISNNVYNFTRYALGMHTKVLATLQEQTATGSVINRMSDSPIEAYRLLGLESQSSEITSQKAAIEEMISVLEISSTVIEELASTFSDMQVNLTQVVSGTYSDSARQELANQIDDALEEVLAFANKTHLGNYIFGGSDTSSAPYVAEYSGDKITGVTYVGSSSERSVEVVAGVESSAYYVGTDLFASSDRGNTEFISDTGAEVGSGTSNIKGDGWITITGTTGNWELSIDAGTTTVSSDGTQTNLAVTDADGNVVYVDTTKITSAGSVYVRAEGTYDMFSSLISLRDILLNEQNLSDGQLEQVRSAASQSLQEISELLTYDQIKLGAKMGFLTDISESLVNIEYNVDEQDALLRDADVAQIAVDLARYELLYEMSLSVSANMLSTSLLDFL